MKTNTTLIKLFGCSIINPLATKVDCIFLNDYASRKGYLVHPDIANEETLAFILAENGVSMYNATFYKDWADVTEKTRLELLIDQILHYESTYGTDFTVNPYIPNDGSVAPEFKQFKVIMPVTAEEMYVKCATMLASGIALKQETMEIVADFCMEYVRETKSSIFDFLDSVKNKEAITYLCKKYNLIPTDKFDLLRYIIFETTGRTLVIKDRATINAIKASQNKFDFNRLNERQLERLASIFYRYKDLFLAFKHDQGSRSFNTTPSKNASIINKLRRMADTYHKPFKAGFVETVLTEMKDFNDVAKYASEMNNYKLITLLQTILEKLQMTGDSKALYLIRNGKSFTKNTNISNEMNIYLAQVYRIFYNQLVENMRTKSTHLVQTDTAEDGSPILEAVTKKVRLPKNCILTCPTSQKNFVGNYPFGTSFTLGDHNTIGIYWRNEWGTHDFDLSIVDGNLQRYGWNSYYTNERNSVIYSGDMTNANPEATELFYFNKAVNDAVVYVNRFNGNDGSRFDLFLSTKEQNAQSIRNKYNYAGGRVGYMIDPNDVQFKCECKSDAGRQDQVAVVSDNRLYLTKVGCGNQLTSQGNSAADMFKIMARKAKSFVSLHDVLTLAGFEIVTDDTVEVDIDLTNPQMDSLINLFA